jgi:hypothetical protein
MRGPASWLPKWIQFLRLWKDLPNLQLFIVAPKGDRTFAVKKTPAALGEPGVVYRLERGRQSLPQTLGTAELKEPRSEKG